MKILFLAFFFSALFISPAENTNLKPYIVGTRYTGNIQTVTDLTKANLIAEGFEVIGVYTPANDINRRVICVSSKELKSSAASIGGLSAMAAALRVGITVAGDEIQVSYTNPYYWGNAYYGKEYTKVENNYKIVNNMFISAMKRGGTYTGRFYGSEKGVSVEDLRDYQYMMGMPGFKDAVELKSFTSFAEATKKIDANLSIANKNYKKVYEIQIPGKNLKVYGIALTAANGESQFLPKIDIGQTKHTAFLPYELLVNENKVVMLHGRFRIAVSFPDLSMSTFTKIMSTPGDIETTMKSICN